MARENDIAVGGTMLHVRIDGVAGRPFVVLVNSLATDLSMWEPQIPALTQRYQVVRYDVRGHGRSQAPPGPYSMAMLVDDLLAVLAHCGAARAHVVGLSLGGVTAAEAALARPAALTSMTICDSRLEVPHEALTMVDERNRLVRERGIAAVVEPFIERWFTPAGRAALPDTVAKVRAMIAGTSVAGFIGCAEALKAARLLDRLHEIALPSLFLVGDADAAVPTAVMQDQRGRVRGSRYAEIPAAGHLSNLEQTAAFNAALLGFLGEIDG